MELKNEYLDIISSTNDLLTPFGNTCLCQVYFSDLTANKTKCRAKLTLKTDLEIIQSKGVRLRFSKNSKAY